MDEKALKRLLEHGKPQFPLGFVVFCFAGAAVGLAIMLVAI